jgi:SPP1 gp7 family putative phage head morphogenesis protein
MADLFDIVVRRQIYIEGLKHAKTGEFAVMLAKLRSELYNRLSTFQYDELGDATKGALKALIADLRKIASDIFDPYLKSLIAWLERFCTVDEDLLAKLFAPFAPKPIERPNHDTLWAYIVNQPLAATGTLALPFLTAQLPLLFVKLERTTFQAYANRSTKSDLIKAIVGTPKAVKQDGLIRQLQNASDAASATIIQHVSSQVALKLGLKITDEYEWVSVLDSHTTEICRSRNGNRYKYGKGPLPPAHVNCRSTTVPVFADSPSSPESFYDWIKKQSDEFVSDALDGRRGSIYERSAPLTLDEYAAKAPLIGQ